MQKNNQYLLLMCIFYITPLVATSIFSYAIHNKTQQILYIINNDVRLKPNIMTWLEEKYQLEELEVMTAKDTFFFTFNPPLEDGGLVEIRENSRENIFCVEIKTE